MSIMLGRTALSSIPYHEDTKLTKHFSQESEESSCHRVFVKSGAPTADTVI
jgi:hypothetical protein